MTGSRLQANKQHKTRFSSKSSRDAHKVPLKEKRKATKSDGNVGKGARAARLQRNQMVRDNKRAELLKQKRASSGSGALPRVIVLFGLSSAPDLNLLEDDLLGLLLSSRKNGNEFPTVASSEYKLRASILKAPHGNLSACMEMAKVADLIAFVASASSKEEGSDSYIDAFGSQCLSVFRTIGLPSTVVLIRDLPTAQKKNHDTKKACISSLASQFPEDCKFYPADTKDELHKFMWLFKEQRLTTPLWRTQRPYLLAEKVDLVDEDCTPGQCTMLLTGYLRAHSLSVNQLIHVSGAGDFQLSKIELLKDPCPLSVRKVGDSMDSDDNVTRVIRCILPDPMKQEPLLVENIPDPLTAEQTWPTEAEMAEADRNHKDKKLKKRKLPPGTNEYMAAWIVDDSDDSYSDTNDNEHDDMVLEGTENGFHGNENGNDFEPDDDNITLPGEFDDKTDTDSVMMDGENLSKEQIEEEIRRIKEAHAEDEEFPDEVDTPIDVPARRRFAKYRGLKSFRTSSWDPKESLPEDYGRIFAFDNFRRTQKHVLAKAEELEQGESDECIRTGSYARLHIKAVPNVVAAKLSDLTKKTPIVSCGLLQHESKISVLHFSVKKHDTYTAPLKAKEELTFHVGFRQFVARPLYSSDGFNTDKSKMERFLHPGRFSIASVYAPICFPPQPLVALKTGGELASPAVAAVGSLRCVDPDRIILKKIILTGYPLRVSKVKATVRFMFHNPEDVKWFKPVELWSKRGRRGRVKEPVGTHGAMKCLFNGVLQQHDTVCMSLYKRSYPKWPSQWFPLLNA